MAQHRNYKVMEAIMMSLLENSAIQTKTSRPSSPRPPTPFISELTQQGRVVRRPVSANPGLNFNLGLFFFSLKAFSRKIFSTLFRVFNHQIVHKKN